MAKYADVTPKILAALEQGMSNRDAIKSVGITEETFYKWLREKNEFSEAVHKAKEIGDSIAIKDVERSLLELAKGFEYEEVRTEYESKLNDKTGKYEPTIKKQVRTKKHVIPSTEAIKFFLTNKAPAIWKNRQETEIKDLDKLKDLHVERIGSREPSGLISHSEDEIKD